MTKYNNCTSFLFNSNSGLCTPGAYINEKQPLPSSEEGDFFQSFYCDTSKGFSVKAYLNTTACLVVLAKKTYAAADNDCQSRGAYLMSVKTVEQLNFFVNLTGSRSAWIGCDDINQEGKFVWKDNGQMMTNSERVNLFAVGEPNDVGGDEDCVIFYTGNRGILDTQCTGRHVYVCEMPYR
ncbi:unnamed protein product [Candidula unifasciata]|uniref:C-type lectin domain-containing protein n=1 Tax=Candidula unifasciata TaxID=100452 RepID=A0A8S3ZMC4_9EUPU|nr:unnamed protein product [Candidula unifasciata]